MAKPFFDISKYNEAFLKDDELRNLSAQITKSDLMWWTMIFLGIKIVALFVLYIMFEKNKEKEMRRDKQRYEQVMAGNMEQDNETVS